MIRTILGFATLALLSSSVDGQSSNPFKSYKTQEEYCSDNPQMPTCIGGKPIDLSKGLSGTLYKPPTTKPAPSAKAEPGPVAKVALEDWRFSHPAPAMLISINIGSLLRSPLLTNLFAASGAAVADIEKARAALSDVGQVLISVTANGTATPSVVMLAKGNIDGALGSLLRSESGMQAKRLDAITVLIGDSSSLAMASLRMRSPYARTTGNSLQQVATREALKYDAWIGFDPARLTSVASALGAAATPGMRSLGNLRGLSAGLYLRDQIRIEASLDAPSPDLAERMLAVYEKAGANRQGEQVWVTAEGAKLRYIEIMEANHLKSMHGLDMIAPQIGPLIRALATSGSAQQSATAAASKPAVPIVIQGLAGGPKELPAK
jgi:hypothetical protein